MIVVTGAAGFIGSCLAAELNRLGFKDLILVDDFTKTEKVKNWKHLQYSLSIQRDEFVEQAKELANRIQFIFHLGARTDTTEFDPEILKKLNSNYSMNVWNLCAEYGIPLIYASSAATYGMGELGFQVDIEKMTSLHPLNPYGQSKLDFDIWALKSEKKPFFWAGFKFFNVYGPNEYHKGRMASVILHAYQQIKQNGKLKLFRSHNPNYQDGEQKRDFVYVKDVIKVMLYFMQHRKNSGIYNLGSGVADTFKHLGLSVFKALDVQAEIEYIDTPEDIRDKYQYYTCADMNPVREAGYSEPFYSLEDGVHDYVVNYLMQNNYY